MNIFEYTKIKYVMIPEEISQHYKLEQLQNTGWVYIEIQKGIYGLP